MYLSIAKHKILSVLNNPDNYRLVIVAHNCSHFYYLDIECANTELFKELFPKLQKGNRGDALLTTIG